MSVLWTSAAMERMEAQKGESHMASNWRAPMKITWCLIPITPLISKWVVAMGYYRNYFKYKCDEKSLIYLYLTALSSGIFRFSECLG